MNTSATHHSNSCPNCQYLHGTTGRPRIAADGALICKCCNTRWREIGNRNTAGADPRISKVSAFSTPIAISTPRTNPKNRPLTRPWNVVGSLVVVLFGLAYIAILPTGAKQQLLKVPDQLVLRNISVENLQNTNTPIWVISGRVTNYSSNHLRVPAISMRSGLKGSSGYVDRIYHPALQNLAPGASFSFRTSIRKPVGNTGGIKLEFIRANQNSG